MDYCKKSRARAPRHCVADTTLQAIQAVSDAAQPTTERCGSPEGEYRSSGDTGAAKLTINKAVHLVGQGMCKVTLGAPQQATKLANW
jgi:hypothetical protein